MVKDFVCNLFNALKSSSGILCPTVPYTSMIDMDWTGIGQGLDRDWTGIGQGLDRDWTGIGQGLDRDMDSHPVVYDLHA